MNEDNFCGSDSKDLYGNDIIREIKMNYFALISKYFWIFAIAVTGLNAYLIKFYSIKYIRENPELSDGYKKIFRSYLFWLNIPWMVMGIGCIIGKVPSIWHFFSFVFLVFNLGS